MDLKTDVLDELDYDPQVDASHIGVTNEDGIVALYGHVRSFTERMAAENAVRRVRGVRAIVNELDVNLPGDMVITDEEIARRAALILHWDPFIDSDSIQIRVQKGQLDLDGNVPNLHRKQRAERVLRHLPGLRGVFNHLQINAPLSPGDIKSRIEGALKRQSETNAQRIQVDVKDGEVTLKGEVGTLLEKSLLADTAAAAPGVRGVTNKLTIGD